MNGGSIDTGPSGIANSQELGSAFGRASVQGEVPDSSYTNGHLPSEGSQGMSDGRPTPFEAPLQGSQASFGTRERGDGARGPERQGSYHRWGCVGCLIQCFELLLLLPFLCMFVCLFTVLGTNRQSSVHANSSSQNVAPK